MRLNLVIYYLFDFYKYMGLGGEIFFMKFLRSFTVGGMLLLGSGTVWANDGDVGLNINSQNITPYSASLSWDCQNNSEVKCYKVFCNGKLLFTTFEYNYDFKSLTPNQNYTFTIKAVDNDGNELKDGSISFKTLAANDSNFFLLNSYSFNRQGTKVSYFDGVKEAMDELYPTPEAYSRKYNDPQKWYDFYNLKTRTPYKTEILNNINFNFFEYGEKSILNSEKSKYLAMTFDGFLVIGEDGEYAFKAEHDNSFILEIDGKEVINEMKYKNCKDASIVKTNLLAGVHRVKITFYEFSGVRSTLLMEWAGPNFNFRPLDGYSFVQLADSVNPYLAKDADFDGVLDSVEAEKGAANNSWDSDGDGLTDYEEIVKFNSKPNQKDSDKDGIEDAIEVKIAKTDLMVVDNNNNENLFSAINTDVQNDKLTLSWEFSGSNVSEYKIYRNFNEIGSTMKTAFTLPVTSEKDVYYIVAVNVNGKRNFKKITPISLNSDQKAYLAWKKRNEIPIDSFFDADFDADGRNNFKEYQLGTNPMVAPLVSAKNLVRIPGLITTYSDKMWASESLQDLSTTKTEILTDINFKVGEAEVLNSGKTDDVHICFKGYFNAPNSGLYKFLTAYDDSITIYIDGVQVFSDDWNYVGYLWSKHLRAGMHSIKIEYYEGSGGAMLDLKWAPPGDELEPMAGDVFWHVKKHSAELNEYIAWGKDSDGDGLTNAYELEHGTDMNNADSDGDGISDYDEINKYNTDPNNADSDGDGISDGDEINKFKSDPNVFDVKIKSYIEIAKLNGAEFTSSTGTWIKQAESIESACAIGTLSYKFSTEQVGVFQLNIKSALKAKRNYKVDIYCDDVLVISEALNNLKENTDYVFEGLVQHLQPGEHTIKLLFDNSNRGNVLTINEVEILKPFSGDLNQDGIDDWVANYAKNLTTLPKVPTTSKVSPVIVEGENKFAETLKINDETVNAYNGENWHKELTLSEIDSDNNFKFNFQNGLKKVAKKIKWVATNILAESDEITVKKGSAMLLTAMPTTENAVFTSAQVTIDNVSYPVAETTPKKITFNEVKDYQIKGSYVDSNGKKIEKTLTVKVIDYTFDKENITMTTASATTFTLPEIPENMYLMVTGNINNALSNSSKLILDSDHWNRSQAVVVRLKDNDQIIATLPIKLIRFYGIGETSFYTVETLEDGTQIMQLESICYPMQNNYSIEYKIFLSGVAFEDGTANKIFNSNQFGITGTSYVRFVKTPAAPKTAACHNATFKINGKKVQDLY